MTGEEIKLSGASRTDAGVHARGQVVNFKTRSPIPLKGLLRALSRMLPDDIAVREVEEADPAFRARDASRKLYSYMIALGDAVPPQVKRFVWHLEGPMDVLSMRRAAKELIGRHDFSSFAVADKRRKAINPVRRIYSIRFKVGKLKDFFGSLAEHSRARAIRIDFVGNGFLYKMVRSMVGTLVDAGRGRIGSKDMKNILSAGKRGAAGRTAPPQGLTLVKVTY